MKAYGKVAVILPIQGNTGYSNQSALKILFRGIGELDLPTPEWNLRRLSIEQISDLHSLTLEIPSGILDVKEIENVSFDDENIVISGTFHWHGKYAGLMGGMSGYARFDVSDVKINESVFVFCMVGQTITAEKYEAIRDRSRILSEGMEHPSEGEVAQVRMTAEYQRRYPDGYNYMPEIWPVLARWEAWLKWLDSPAAIALEAKIEAQRLADLEHRQQLYHRKAAEEAALYMAELADGEDYADEDYADEDYADAG